MKPHQITLGATYKGRGLDSRDSRTVIGFRTGSDGRVFITFVGRSGERTVYLTNFAKWAEVEVRG